MGGVSEEIEESIRTGKNMIFVVLTLAAKKWLQFNTSQVANHNLERDGKSQAHEVCVAPMQKIAYLLPGLEW